MSRKISADNSSKGFLQYLKMKTSDIEHSFGTLKVQLWL